MHKTMFKHIQSVWDLGGATFHTFRHTPGIPLNGASIKALQGFSPEEL